MQNIIHVFWRIVVGVSLIYLPILTTVPFVVVCVFVVKTHLRMMGAENFRPYWDFVPDWTSHRYGYSNQMIYSSKAKWYSPRSFRWFWIFNCKLYCPLSVALFRYTTSVVKIVENWWCPFNHDQKCNYGKAAIDKSYWHLRQQEAQRLYPDDRNNSIWNQDE